MLFNFGGKQINFKVSQNPPIISKHSNQPLEQLTLIASVAQQLSEEYSRCIATAKEEGVTSIDENGNVLKRWTVRNHSQRSNSDALIHQFSIEVAENEVLNPSSLQIGELNLHPYMYKEYFSGDKLHIEARVVLTEEQHSLFQSLMKPFDSIPVVRHGISEESRQMFLSNGYWSSDGNEIKSEVYLVDPSEPSINASVPPLQFVHQMGDQIALTQALVDGVLKALATKGVLTDEEIAQTREEVVDLAWRYQYNFYKVKELG